MMRFQKVSILIFLLIAGACSRPVHKLHLWILTQPSHPTVFIAAPLQVRALIDPELTNLEAVTALLSKQNVASLDHLILTRVTPESLEASWRIAQKMTVKNFYYPYSKPKPAALLEYEEKFNSAKTRVRSLNRHQYIPLKLAEFIILNPIPTKNPIPGSEAPQLSMKLIFGKSAALFTGALKAAQLDDLLQVYRQGLRSNLIILPPGAEPSPAFRNFMEGSTLAGGATEAVPLTHYVSDGSSFSRVED